MVNVELRILFTNALPQQTGTLTKFIQILLKMISNSAFTTTGCHLITRTTPLSKYVWEIKEKFKIIPSLKWSIIKSIPAYSNISKKCQLCLQDKFEFLNYPNPSELLNKRSELISRCHHVNKFLSSNYKSGEQTLWKMPNHINMMTSQLLNKQ